MLKKIIGIVIIVCLSSTADAQVRNTTLYAQSGNANGSVDTGILDLRGYATVTYHANLGSGTVTRELVMEQYADDGVTLIGTSTRLLFLPPLGALAVGGRGGSSVHVSIGNVPPPNPRNGPYLLCSETRANASGAPNCQAANGGIFTAWYDRVCAFAKTTGGGTTQIQLTWSDYDITVASFSGLNGPTAAATQMVCLGGDMTASTSPTGYTSYSIAIPFFLGTTVTGLGTTSTTLTVFGWGEPPGYRTIPMTLPKRARFISRTIDGSTSFQSQTRVEGR